MYPSSSYVTDRIKVMKVTYPTVPTAQNGSDTATAQYFYYDDDGELRWARDGEGRVSYASFDTRNGNRALVVTDVFTGTSEGSIDPAGIVSPADANVRAWSGGVPYEDTGSLTYSFRTTAGSSTDYARLLTKSGYDTRGRATSVTAADGQISYVAHLDNETRVYPSWDSGTGRTRLPVVRVLTQYDGGGSNRFVTRQSVTVASITYAGTPHDGSESWPTDQTTWTSYSKATYNAEGRMASQQVWHDIPSSSGDGSSPTNYYETTFTYSTVTTGTKGLLVEVRDPQNGWTKTHYNLFGQPVTVWETVKSTTPSDGDYKKLAEFFYGQSSPGTGVSRGGDLSAMRDYYGSGSTDYRQSEYYYDARGFINYVRHEDGGGTAKAPHTCYDHDNLGRVTAVATYKAATITPTTISTSTTTDRVALSKTHYDNLNRVYLSEDYSIGSSGAIEQISTRDKKLVTRYFYDRRNQLVAVDPPDSGVLISKPDGAGRIVESWVCSEMEHTDSAVYSSGAFDYANADIRIVEKSVMTLNELGNPTQITHRELNHDDAEMSSGDSDNVATYTHSWYDTAGRLSASAYYGTNQSSWATTTAPTYSSTIATRSDSVLVTSYAYDSAGRLQTATDPKALVTEYAYDDLGRPTLVTEDKGTGGGYLNRQTTYTYDGLSNVSELAAKAVADYNGGGLDDQVTQYLREDTVNPNWVTEVRYPNPGTGAASSSSVDKVALTYSRDGTLASRTDQLGTVMNYTYDARGRLTDQTATTIASASVDGSVRRISNAYNTTGRLETVTSWANTGATGTAPNQVKFTYDGFGMLTKDEQAHEDAVTSGTPAISYGYGHSSSTDETSYQNYFDRLQSIQYPNGRYVWYVYDAHSTSGIGALNNLLSRVGRIADGDSSAASRAFAEYSYNGLGRMVQRDHLNNASGSTGKFGNKTALRFIKQSGASGATYPDFDRFGRITAVRQLNYNSYAVDSASAAEAVRYNYGYDANSNRTFAEAIHNPARSQIYSYDSLNRLTSAKLGELASSTALTSEWPKPSEQAWTLDLLGNWSTFNRSTASTDANETRTHNATNEIDSRTVAYETARYWVSDDFADNDTAGWSTADLNNAGGDGAWGAASSKLSCTGVVTPTPTIGGTGPDATTQGSIFLIDKGQFQDAYISCSATLVTGCKNAGIVFGYVDPANFWVRIYSLTSQKIWVYQVSGGTWYQRNQKNQSITSNVAITMEAIVGSGRAQDYDGAVPLGKVGLWVSDGSNNSFDDFKVRNTAGPYEIDGRWFSDKGDVRVDNSDNNVLETTGVDENYRLMVRRGFIGDKFVLEYDFKFTSTANRSGALVRWLDNDNWIAVHITSGAAPIKLVQRKKGATLTTLASNSTAPSLTNGLMYTARVVIGSDGGSGQNLKFTIDSDRDGDFADETTLLNTDVIDNDWSAGCVGLFRAANDTTAHQFDDFKVGIDNNADGDVDDGGDDVQIDDNFDSGAITLTHDDAGNLTDDGVFLYVYDAWNRLVKVTRRLDAFTTVAEYEYDGLNRRIRKVVSNCGDGLVPGSDDLDGNGTPDATGIPFANRSEHYYYAGWRVIEERDNNGSTGRVLAQTVYGTEYIDEPVCRDRNLDVSTDSTPAADDCLDGSGGTTGSTRYFYHQDANYRVTAVTSESGTVVERYEYEAYGEPRVYAGQPAGGTYESGALVSTSYVGNPLMHQGLRRDDETGLHENRYRMLHSRVGRFMQRDPLGYADGLSSYAYLRSCPPRGVDPSGNKIEFGDRDGGLSKSECEKKAKECLEKLKKDKELKRIIEHLEKSKHTHAIKCLKNNTKWGSTTRNPSADDNDASVTPGVGCGSEIVWNPDYTRLRSAGTPDAERDHDPCAGLAHELSHAYARDTGTATGKLSKTGVTLEEEAAVRLENRARWLFKNAQRTYYGDKKCEDAGKWRPEGAPDQEP